MRLKLLLWPELSVASSVLSWKQLEVSANPPASCIKTQLHDFVLVRPGIKLHEFTEGVFLLVWCTRFSQVRAKG